jgi:peroxiredoxin
MRFLRLLAFLALAPLALAAAPSADSEKSYQNVSLDGPDGKPVTLASLAGKKATVVVFLSFDCPVSTSYVSPLNDLARAHDGVVFVGVAPGESADGLKKAVKEYQVSFPVRPDAKKATTKALGAKVTPEVFVFDADLKLRYRGRIDDGYVARLKKNARVTSHDLKDALAAVVAGKAVKQAVTTAVGCSIEIDVKAAKEAKVTYHRDVAGILQKHCQSCHRPGEVGPFSLTSYKQARRWAADVKEYTQSRQMPPWMPRAGGPFRNERRLSDKEIETLAAWADAGAPEGDEKDAPPPLKYADGWQRGKPDLVLSAKDAFHVAAAGKDVFRCFVIPTGLKEHVWVTGYEVKPGAPRVVHHTLHYFDVTGTARKMEQKAQEREKTSKPADHGPGYSVAMGVGFTPPASVKGELPKFGGLGGWAPGQGAQTLPKGAGFFLPAGSDFLLQVHYHRDGKPADDRTQIGLYFTKAPVEQPWQTAIITGMRYDEVIPAGKARHVSRGAVYLHDDALLHNVMPHMHLLGKSVKVTMTPPEGKPTTVIAGRRRTGLKSRSWRSAARSWRWRASLTTATRTPTTPTPRRRRSASASRRPTRCSMRFWA